MGKTDDVDDDSIGPISHQTVGGGRDSREGGGL